MVRSRARLAVVEVLQPDLPGILDGMTDPQPGRGDARHQHGAGRRRHSRRYTYGYGRAEDLAGVVIVLVIGASSALAAYAAVTRLAHPRPVSNLAAVAVAALIGFTGNELVARYRIRVGRRIGSAAPVAVGPHARTDG